MRFSHILCTVAALGYTGVGAKPVQEGSLAIRDAITQLDTLNARASNALEVCQSDSTEFIDLLSQFLTELPGILNDLEGTTVELANDAEGTFLDFINDLVGVIDALSGLAVTDPAALSTILNAFISVAGILAGVSAAV